MFSQKSENIMQIGVGQYWPTWAFYSMKDQSFNNLPLNIIPLNSSKLGSMEWRPQEQSDNQSKYLFNSDNLNIQRNCYENDLSEN